MKNRSAAGASRNLRAAEAAQAETALEARIKALEGGFEALKAAVDAKEAEVRQHLIGKLKEKVQRAKQMLGDFADAIAEREQAARDEAQSQIRLYKRS